MDPLKNKYTYFQRLKHQFQARRDIPFRRKFFIGYDLNGNTYWEFTIDGNMQRLRRKMDPYKPLLFKADYFDTVPPQWLQWLRRTRNVGPTLEELVNDQIRQSNLKVLAKHADEKWIAEKVRLEQEQQHVLDSELSRAKLEGEAFTNQHKQAGQDEVKAISADPWKQADADSGNPIQPTSIKPRSH